MKSGVAHAGLTSSIAPFSTYGDSPRIGRDESNDYAWTNQKYDLGLCCIYESELCQVKNRLFIYCLRQGVEHPPPGDCVDYSYCTK